jgi:hypothetical protein
LLCGALSRAERSTHVSTLDVIAAAEKAASTGPQAQAYEHAASALLDYDIVVAISQGTLNFQFQHLWKHKVLPQAFDIKVGKKELNVTAMGPPVVDLAMVTSKLARDAESALLKLPITHGSFTYWDTSGDDPVLKTEPLDGVTMAFRVELKLEETSLDAIQRTSDQGDSSFNLVESFSDFSEEVFDISHVLADFEHVDLDTWDPDSSILGGLSAEGGTELAKFWSTYLQEAAKSANPYILGYSVTKQPDSQLPADKALFAPTAATFSTSVHTPPSPDTAGLATLNFLMASGSPDVSPPSGQFASNWIPSPDVYGTFAVSRQLFRERYVAQYVLPRIADAMGIPEAFTETATGWTVAHSESSKTNHPNLDSGMVDVHQTDSYDAGCDVTIADGSFPVMVTASGYMYRKAFFEEHPLGIDTTYWGDARQEWTLTIEVSAADNGELVLAPAVTAGQLKTNSDESWLAKAADAVGGLFTRTVAQNMDDIKQLLGSIENDLVQAFQGRLAAGLNGLQTMIVMPAGDTFDFKQVALSPEGNLLMQATYKG